MYRESLKNNGMDTSKDYGFVELEITGQTRLQLETGHVHAVTFFASIFLALV
jgi:hypothetical protein